MRIALALLMLASLPQDKAPDRPCDLAAVEDVLWCPKCKKIREKEQLVEEKCKECKSEPEKIKACVKKWIPRCGMHGQQPHLECCCKSKKCCQTEVNKSPVTFACEGCGKSARSEAAIPHEGKEHEKKIVKKCEGSGVQPHGGAPIEPVQK